MAPIHGGPPRRATLSFVLLLFAMLGVLLPFAPAPVAASASPAPSAAGSAVAGSWTAAWGIPMAWGFGAPVNATVRQLATLSAGGDAVRVRVSNAFGKTPATFGAASVGVQSFGGAVVAGSLQNLTFGGSPAVTIPAGATAYSDPVSLEVSAGQTLAVSVFLSGTVLASVHPCCAPKIQSYYTPNNAGNHVDDLAPTWFHANYFSEWVDAVDVSGSVAPGVVAALGDSITDGFRSAALDWPEALQERLRSLPASQQPAVLDEGIAANTLVTTTVSDALLGGGPPGLARIQRDVFSRPGVTTIILAEGTNDLWFGATAAQVIAGMEEVVALGHAAGIRVIGTTILPRAGSERWTLAMEAERLQVNTWVRTSGAFDGVVDFARVVEDAYDGGCQTAAIFPPFDSGDHLHPDPAGEKAMADAVDGELLSLPPLPTLPVVVPVTSTVAPGIPPVPLGVTETGVTPTAVTPTFVTHEFTVSPSTRTPGCDPGPEAIVPASLVPLPTPSPSPSPAPSPSPSPRPLAAGTPGGKGLSGTDRVLLGVLGVSLGLAVVLGLGIIPVRKHHQAAGRTPGGPGRGPPDAWRQ